MRILITGITGFVGGHLAELLVADDDEVIGLSASGRWGPASAHLEGHVPLRAWDFARANDQGLAGLLREENPDAIIHLAAQANPQASNADPRGTWATNLGGAMNLLEGVRASGLRPRVVLVSSGVCYGSPPAERIPIDETCPLRPTDPYGASKAAADMLGIQQALAHGLDAVIVRPFNHSGPRQSPRYVLSGLARQVAEVEAGKREQVLVGNLDVVRDFTDVRDVVRAYRLLCRQGRAGEVYNLGTGRGVRLGEALDRLRALARAPIAVQVEAARFRPHDAPILVADASKLRREAGWEPNLPLDRTLADMLEDWRTRHLMEIA